MRIQQHFLLFSLCLIFHLNAFSQGLPPTDNVLVSGPMVGYCEMREVMLWVQTNGTAIVQIEYSAGEGSPTYRTPAYQTRQDQAFTAHLIADQVLPGTTYSYKLFINGKEVQRPYDMVFQTPPLWQWRTDPPEFSIAMGSGTYINDEAYDRPGRPYGADYRIFESIHKQSPDIMLWLGDNNYLREADWNSATGIVHRNTHTRQIEEMQALLASTANYAIWDDHDYGPNDSDYTYWGKTMTSKAFQLFWGNPSYGLPGLGGTTSVFEWGDAHFFLLDNRYFRDPNDRKTSARSILGEEQLQWLLDALVSSKATFKFVVIGGQVINDVAKYENYANVAPAERSRILNTIVDEGIKNVIFLTGDRHHSEISLFEKNGIKIYDVTSSPLTSGPNSAQDEPNTLRVKGSFVGERNFAVLYLSGKRTERKVGVKFFDSDGKELWAYDFEAQK
ncbi:MAG: alkaline phosphatase D family protein [Bacteroidota bacterium]